MYLLQEQWERLDQAVAAHGKMLEESRDFLEFLQKVDHAEAWIRDKVSEFADNSFCLENTFIAEHLENGNCSRKCILLFNLILKNA